MSQNESNLASSPLRSSKTIGIIVVVIGIFLLLPLMIGFISAKLSATISLQGSILAGILFPAILLALLRPKL